MRGGNRLLEPKLGRKGRKGCGEFYLGLRGKKNRAVRFLAIRRFWVLMILMARSWVAFIAGVRWCGSG